MPQFMTADDAVKAIANRMPGGGRIYVPGCAAEPTALIHAWRQNPQTAADLTFTGVWIPGVNKVDYAALHETANAETFFLAPELADSFKSHKTAYLPMPYTDIFPYLETVDLAAAVLHLSEADTAGYHSLGIAADFTPAVMSRDCLKIGLINNEMPFCTTAPSIRSEDLDIIIETTQPLISYDAGSVNDDLKAIARHILPLLRDGDTLQFGLGKVQKAVLQELSGLKKIRLHAGMISDPALGLLGEEILDTRDGAITTGVALGSPALYNQCAKDKRIHFQPVSYTHDHEVLRRIDRLVAINSVVEVDLFGQANAEWIGGRQASGSGGLVDFLRGARRARGGRPIIALPSTAKRGQKSRILPVLPAGIPASIARGDATIVVTEHGIADLRNCDIDARAEKLVSIADPSFQSSLADEWRQMRKSMP